MTAIAEISVATDADGVGWGSVQLPDGFAVKPGVRLCVGDLLGSVETSATVRGYLAKDR
jgi:hypothetical protein